MLIETLLILAGNHWACAQPISADRTRPGPHAVATMKVDWRDEKRTRDVPVKIYYPKDRKGSFPVIVFSHGLGGTREGYEYLGGHWASHGYVCVHLQHKGSDDAVWKGTKQPLAAMRKAVQDPSNAINRLGDVRFALDQLSRLNGSEEVLKGHLDLARVGMAGHSFGGWTTQAMIGEVFVLPGGKEVAHGDPRIKAAVIMSPSAAPGKSDQAKAFGAIKVPCLHMTGTKDDSVGITATKPAERRVPYDHMVHAPQILVIFKDGDHMIFAGARGQIGDGAKDARFHDLIRASTTAFWDTYLKEDAAAREWLGEGFRRLLGTDGTLESKGSS